MKNLISFTLAMLISLSVAVGQEKIKKIEVYGNPDYVYLDEATGSYLSSKEFRQKYGDQAFKQFVYDNSPDAARKKRLGQQLSRPQEGYVYKLKPLNTTIGGCAIGVACATYAISSSIISDKLNKETDADKMKSLRNSQSTIGYICGGISLAGAVVILTGLHKEYQPNKGVALSNNIYIDNTNSGVSLALTF